MLIEKFSKQAIGMTGRARELQDTIIERTAQKLEHVFGMAFHELPEKKGQYILVNKLFQTKEDTHIDMLPKVRNKIFSQKIKLYPR